MDQSKTKFSVLVSGQDYLSWTRGESLEHKCCFSLSKLIQNYRSNQGENPSLWNEPTGNSHSEILMRLFIRKCKGQFSDPYTHEELCHCRSVSTDFVVKAIVNGAQNVDSIAQWTTAGTACGTCRVDSQKILDSLLVSNI